MNDERDKAQEAEVPAEEEEAPAHEEPELREFSREEMEEILTLHSKWVKSEGTEGQKANLRRTNLILDEIDFREANLRVAHLNHSSLFKADFRGADLSGADLRETNLIDVDFRRAILRGANLEGIRHISGMKLAGSNLDGVIGFPKDLIEFQELKTVEELSKSAKKIFQIMLLGCIYAGLTIATTEDARLITNSVSSPLPIIQTQIPIVWFYWVAPFLLLGVYFYLHIYLQHLWAGLADLPAVFPDGKSLDRRAYPWFLNGIIRVHLMLLRHDRPPLSRLQAGVAIFLAWWTTPLALIFFWFRYLPRHDWVITSLHNLFLGGSILCAFMLYRLATITLRGELWEQLNWKIVLQDMTIYKLCAYTTGLFMILFLLSFYLIGGDNPPYFADLGGADLHGADLKKAWLQGANLSNADLHRADLQKARLQWANLSNADLRKTNLQHSNLANAILFKANLSGANMEEARLFHANIQETNFVKSIGLTVPQVKEANSWTLAFYDTDFLMGLGLSTDHNDKVSRKNLSKDFLQNANLQDAMLNGYNLQEANLQEANLHRANLQRANLVEADLHRANLQRANLVEADLQGTKLQGANLGWADLQGAKLRGAKLRGADFRGAKNLTIEQVESAKNWELAFYDDEFLNIHGEELRLPQSEKEHAENVKKKLAMLEKEEKAGDGKK